MPIWGELDRRSGVEEEASSRSDRPERGGGCGPQQEPESETERPLAAAAAEACTRCRAAATAVAALAAGAVTAATQTSDSFEQLETATEKIKRLEQEVADLSGTLDAVRRAGGC